MTLPLRFGHAHLVFRLDRAVGRFRNGKLAVSLQLELLYYRKGNGIGFEHLQLPFDGGVGFKRRIADNGLLLEKVQPLLVEQDRGGSLVFPRHQTKHRGAEGDTRNGEKYDDSPMAPNETADPLEPIG